MSTLPADELYKAGENSTFSSQEVRVSVYKVHFKWKDKEVVLKAKSLDLTHPYFVSIRDIDLPSATKIIIDPTEDEIRKTFGRADHLMIPFQTVSLIEELKEDQPDRGGKIRPFTVVEGGPEKAEEDDSE
ncbi:DUF1820 family protein [Salinispira pacifica]